MTQVTRGSDENQSFFGMKNKSIDINTARKSKKSFISTTGLSGCTIVQQDDKLLHLRPDSGDGDETKSPGIKNEEWADSSEDMC